MIVEPGFTRHPKYLLLKKAVAKLDPPMVACEVLLLLWEHCQLGKKGAFWEGVEIDYVEAVCGWMGESGVLFKILASINWLKKTETGVLIHGWDEHNGKLVSNWSNGPKGGRPKKTSPTDNPSITQTKPTVKPTGTDTKTGAKPKANPTVTDRGREGLDRLDREREGGTPAHSSLEEFPEPEWPTKKAVVTECELRGIPTALGETFWHHYEAAHPKWSVNGRPIGDWRHKLRNWSVNERERGHGQPGTGSKNGGQGAAAAELESIAAQLQWEQDPKKIEELKKRRKELSA